jgi:hypothetical protein
MIIKLSSNKKLKKEIILSLKTSIKTLKTKSIIKKSQFLNDVITLIK